MKDEKKKLTKTLCLVLVMLAACLSVAAEKPTQAPAEKPTADEGTNHLALPGKTWSLDIALPGFVREETNLAPAGDALNIMSYNKTTGIRISVFLEPAAGKGDARTARGHYWQKAHRSALKEGPGVKVYEQGAMALVESETTGIGGTVWKNVNAYLVKNDVWIDIHLSKMGFVPADAKHFDAVLEGVRINDNYTPVLRDYIAFGVFFSQSKNYHRAAENFQAALELEKKDPTLPETQWRSLVVKLGIAYGTTGDLEKAKAIFEYGISKDAKYPLFYYNLGCTYAEMDDLDKAIANLKSAFDRKADLSADMRMPDPRTDSSFKKYLSDPKFVAVLREIEGQPRGK